MSLPLVGTLHRRTGKLVFRTREFSKTNCEKMMMLMHFFGDRQSHLIACSFKQCWFAMPNGLRLWHKDGNPPNARYGSERSCIAMVMMGVFSSSTRGFLYIALFRPDMNKFGTNFCAVPY